MSRSPIAPAARASRGFSLARLFGRRPIERPAEETVAPPPSNRQSSKRRGQRSELYLCLQQAFDSKPGMRDSLVHLAYIESGLRRIGDESIVVSPASLLTKALNQLEILMGVSSPSRGLMLLSLRLKQVLEQKGTSKPGVGVSDASLDEYDQAVRDSDMAALLATP